MRANNRKALARVGAEVSPEVEAIQLVFFEMKAEYERAHWGRKNIALMRRALKDPMTPSRTIGQIIELLALDKQWQTMRTAARHPNLAPPNDPNGARAWFLLTLYTPKDALKALLSNKMYTLEGPDLIADFVDKENLEFSNIVPELLMPLQTVTFSNFHKHTQEQRWRYGFPVVVKLYPFNLVVYVNYSSEYNDMGIQRLTEAFDSGYRRLGSLKKVEADFQQYILPEATSRFNQTNFWLADRGLPKMDPALVPDSFRSYLRMNDQGLTTIGGASRRHRIGAQADPSQLTEGWETQIQFLDQHHIHLLTALVLDYFLRLRLNWIPEGFDSTLVRLIRELIELNRQYADQQLAYKPFALAVAELRRRALLADDQELPYQTRSGLERLIDYFAIPPRINYFQHDILEQAIQAISVTGVSTSSGPIASLIQRQVMDNVAVATMMGGDLAPLKGTGNHIVLATLLREQMRQLSQFCNDNVKLTAKLLTSFGSVYEMMSTVQDAEAYLQALPNPVLRRAYQHDSIDMRAWATVLYFHKAPLDLGVLSASGSLLPAMRGLRGDRLGKRLSTAIQNRRGRGI